MLENSVKEALIGIANWYDEVNKKGCVTIDDLTRLKIFADLSKDVLAAQKGISGTKIIGGRESWSPDGSDDWSYPVDDEISF